MKKMKAAVDIGSNTVQMLAGFEEHGQIVPVYRYLATTRLGAGGQPNHLSERAMAQTVTALAEIQAMLTAEGVRDIRLLATSAVRDAENQATFLDLVKRTCGLDVLVLSGAEEAQLSYRGAISVLDGRSALVLDIGGGSTELIRENAADLLAVSYNIGAVRAQNYGWQRAEIVQQFSQKTLPTLDKSPLVGVGGTITTAAAIRAGVEQYSRQAVQGRVLSRQWLLQLRDHLAALPVEARCMYSPLLQKRGEIIVEGLTILEVVMERLGVDCITASDAGFLDGALLLD